MIWTSAAAQRSTITARSLPDSMDNSVDCYISTGDNHWLGQSLAIDSEKSIYDALKMMKDVYNTRTLYWRGLQEAAWNRKLFYRKENYRYSSAFKWFGHLMDKVKVEQIVTRTAHKMGMELWGVSTLGDWGSTADTPGFNDFPFCFESSLRIDNPEWAPVDKYGYRKQGGTIELAYPEARKALVELHTQLALEAGYDGVTLLTYVENFTLRFADEFGYSEPIVEAFKKRYGIDIRKENFTKAASRTAWYKLRGEYVTLYLRELKESLNKAGIKLGMFLDPVNPYMPMTWATLPHTHSTIGNIYMDVSTWVRDGIVDRLQIFGNVPGDILEKTAEDMIWLTRETPVKVSILSSNPYAKQWEKLKNKSVRVILSLGDDEQYLLRSKIPVQTIQALKSGTIYEKMRFLCQVLDGKSAVTTKEVILLAGMDNVIMKRLALLVLGKLKDPIAVPVIEKAFKDKEIGVQSAAVRAISDNSRPGSINHFIKMIENTPAHPLLEMARATLHKMSPFPKKELTAAALTNRVPEVRITAFRVLDFHASDDLIPAYKKGLMDNDGYVRYTSALALGKFKKNKDAVGLLIASTNHFDPAVENRAAVSLGEMVLRKDEVAIQQYNAILQALKTLFIKSGDATARTDKDWGYRSVGNALMDCGKEGIKVLEEFTRQRTDKRLAELAWRVLTYKEKASSNSFNLINEKENDNLFSNRPWF